MKQEKKHPNVEDFNDYSDFVMEYLINEYKLNLEITDEFNLKSHLRDRNLWVASIDGCDYDVISFERWRLMRNRDLKIDEILEGLEPVHRDMLRNSLSK
ncbi:hypothetical protein UFOVP182_28 [uncultured Caudovirales phage]|uniref:Uncharacterized protein n=1 Tax=uncultured Caudovirales phage TaxID=2100421 RepID=A0A6J7WI88_9CAUD|nr:hypothetical protein UFOVP182_28 [uncultured Caudovirales phage]